MTKPHTPTFVQALRQHLAPANQKLLDEVASHEFVREVLQKAEDNTLAERRAKLAELAAIPAAHEKAIRTAGAAHMSAVEAEAEAEAALDAARKRRQAAFGAVYGLENAARIAADRIRDELRASASPVIAAALQSVRAFDLWRHVPDYVIVFVPYIDPFDEIRLAAALAEEAEVDKANAVLGARIQAAQEAIAQALGALDEMLLEALTESAVAARVHAIFGRLNVALQPFKGNPHFVLKDGAARVEFGVDEKAFEVKAADIGKSQSGVAK